MIDTLLLPLVTGLGQMLLLWQIVLVVLLRLISLLGIYFEQLGRDLSKYANREDRFCVFHSMDFMPILETRLK